ncbi:AraC family transcriptional regulator [Methylovirgula sp. 4M-Z18]|nr:AraC family transcriptional regulator [Methylovirgula sp. 4M-Z18]
MQSITMAEQPMAYVSGSATWDEGYTKLQDGFKQVRGELDKAGLKAIGRPMALFLDTDDKGFRYEALILLESAPEGKTELSPDVKIGKTPAGKVLKFQHHGAYDEISSTYEAIAAYLDEKDLEAQNLLIEEYVNDVSGSDDVNLDVNIYVYIK